MAVEADVVTPWLLLLQGQPSSVGGGRSVVYHWGRGHGWAPSDTAAWARVGAQPWSWEQRWPHSLGCRMQPVEAGAAAVGEFAE